MAKNKQRGKNWWTHFPVAGGKRYTKHIKSGSKLEATSTNNFWHRKRFSMNIIGMIYPKKLYPTAKHLPVFRRNIDVFADLRT